MNLELSLLRRAVLLLVLAPLAIACGSKGPPLDEVQPVSESMVGMKNSRFGPRVIQIAPGAEVTWQFNDGGTKHNVRGDDWGSEVEDSGSFRHTFREAGTYDYKCTLHNGMNGRVIVE